MKCIKNCDHNWLMQQIIDKAVAAYEAQSLTEFGRKIPGSEFVNATTFEHQLCRRHANQHR